MLIYQSISYPRNIAIEPLCLLKSFGHIYTPYYPLMNQLTYPHIRETMLTTFGPPKIFGIEIRPATSRSDTKPLLYSPSLDGCSIYAGPSAQDSDDDEPLANPPKKSKDLEHFLGLPMRNIATPSEEMALQRSAGGEEKPERSKKYGRWMISRTRISAKKERWVSRARKMMQQNVLRRHSLGNQI
ncbi:MAG: hypothetical protein OHK93_000927 [Ramalina farinacea]|uniref:Uncharacterized protein n=1 Tax=Ramalina farinacea TaxID=258253 RepID=A0AA43QQ93_9LECA|nr:hypothetical protein [Ramalina farinacea]